jgi:hypothetical protein
VRLRFAYNLPNIEREEYDFTVEFHETVAEPEQLAVINLLEAAPNLLQIVQAVAELRRKWRSKDEIETIDSIEYMDGLDALEVDAAIAKATAA